MANGRGGADALPALLQAEKDRRRQAFQDATHVAGPQALSDTLQSLQDPHNQENRPLTPERVKIQELVESGFADTLFRAVGRPQNVRPLPRSEEAFGTGGLITDAGETVEVSSRLPASDRRRVLSHELGHRLFGMMSQNRPPREMPEQMVADRGRFQTLVDQVTSLTADLEEGDPRTKISGEDFHRASEEFAQIFEAALSTVRRYGSAEERGGGDQEVRERFEQVVEKSVEETKKFVRDEREALDGSSVKTVVRFLLDQPVFDDHPLKRDLESSAIELGAL